MKFSIILPSHNGASRIWKALESIKKQTFTDYELIVVCDACDDATSIVARSYGAIVLECNHQRAGLARNDALAIVEGDYIVFMDDDDYWLHDNVLEMINNRIEMERTAVDVLCFSFIFNNADGTVRYARYLDDNDNYWTAVWNKCWRREYIKGCQFSDEIQGSDVVFTNQVFKKLGHPHIVRWDMPLYMYNHMRTGSITETATRERGTK